jgi:hypothetical protein
MTSIVLINSMHYHPSPGPLRLVKVAPSAMQEAGSSRLASGRQCEASGTLILFAPPSPIVFRPAAITFCAFSVEAAEEASDGGEFTSTSHNPKNANVQELSKHVPSIRSCCLPSTWTVRGQAQKETKRHRDADQKHGNMRLEWEIHKQRVDTPRYIRRFQAHAFPKWSK